MSKVRNLAFAGLLGVAGCAGTAEVVRPHGPTRPEVRTPVLPTETCLRQTTRLQECMIEGMAGVCRERTSGNEEGMLSCMREGLSQPVAPAHRDISVTVAQGEEVFSMRVGGPAIFEIVKMEATAVDAAGVGFTFTVDRVLTATVTQHATLETAQMRMNFDGTRTGDWSAAAFTELWHFQVQAGESGRARVSFETDNPAITVRGAAAPTIQASEKATAPAKTNAPEKQPPAKQNPPVITEP
ncbi:MAG TPA: hypothetical protein VLD37_02420 [Candidatus Bilamarchaeum sp.]|nr:hypothetical protein [Candidatus Bilamarchaeum sp.]